MLHGASRKNDDIHALGSLITGLMEGTDWGTELRSFVQATTEAASIDVLSKHSFLKLSSGPSSLIPHVRVVAATSKRFKWSLAPVDD